MRIAVVGSGISGLVCAWLLRRDHDVTVFEADDRIGGHTHTMAVDAPEGRLAVDTGFIVHNRETYPSFTRILDKLGVESVDTSMSFSVRCDATGLEYNGTSFDKLFAQRRNLLRPSFHRMLRDIVRFNRMARTVLAEAPDDLSIREFLVKAELSREFERNYLIPLGASLWSCPAERFYEFPIRFLLRFLDNHGMTTINDRPQWRVVKGGSYEYVKAMTRDFADSIHLSTPVLAVRRDEDVVRVETSRAAADFDHVVFACHSDQALRILTDPSPLEDEVLTSFPYQANDVALHTDVTVLPRRRRAWASWNYRIPAEPRSAATVTYDMNILQGLDSRDTHCVTLNDTDALDPSAVIARMTYHHPIYTASGFANQNRHEQLVDVNRTSFCGAYWGNGFHEDGVVSALTVCRALGTGLDS